MFYYPPDSGVVLTGHLCKWCDRHLLGISQHCYFKDQSEPATSPSPGDTNQMDAMYNAVHSWHPGSQECLVFEEVQVQPTLLCRVVYRTC